MSEVISVRGGPLCSICKNTPANVSPRCDSCGTVIKDVCFDCAKGDCAHCGNAMVAPPQFPKTLLNAINRGDADEVERLAHMHQDALPSVKPPPLHLAACHENKDVALAMCKVLTSAGIARDARDDAGRTALIELMRYRPAVHRKLVEFFDATVNAQDDQGRTALMFAVTGAGVFGSRKGSMSAAQMLVAAKADLDLRDHSGHTALWWAKSDNDKETNTDMVGYLEDEMVAAAAKRLFKQNYKHAFDDNGALIVMPKTP